MRWPWGLLVAVVCLMALASPALAHGGGLGALIEVSPDVPPPGQVTAMKMQILDVLGATIPEGKVKVTVRPPGNKVPQAEVFQEPESGLYTGNVAFPGPGMAVLRVEAILADGLYTGEVSVEVGKYEVNGMVVSLTHQDAVGVPGALAAAPIPAPPGGAAPAARAPLWYQAWWLWAGVATLALGGGALLLGRRGK